MSPQSREVSPVNYAGGVDFQQRIHRPSGRRFNSVKELKQCVSQSVNGINCGNVSTSGVIHRDACVIVTISSTFSAILAENVEHVTTSLDGRCLMCVRYLCVFLCYVLSLLSSCLLYGPSCLK